MQNSTHLQARVLSRITKQDRGYRTPCWISNRATQPNGYTKIGVNQVTCLTHRVAYEAWVGPIPAGLVLDHLCGQRACCNPAHLEPVTNYENTSRSPKSPAGIGAQRTHCRAGHLLDEANTYRRPDRTHGTACLACIRAARARAKQGAA